MGPTPVVIAIVRDAGSLDVIRTTLETQAIQVRATGDAVEGWELVQKTRADAILVEASVAHGTGLLERIANRDPGANVLLLTHDYTSECAIEGIQQGACGCLKLPLSVASLEQRIAEVLDDARLRRETLALDGRLMESYRFHGMVGRSPLMLDTFARIRRVAPHYRVALAGCGKSKLEAWQPEQFVIELFYAWRRHSTDSDVQLPLA